MSTGMWRQTIARAANLRARALGVAEWNGEPAATETNTAVVTFVRRIFFASAQRARVFFAASDSETDISDFCRRIGRCLADTSRGRVGIVTRNYGPAPVPGWADESLTAVDLGGNLWRVPFKLCEKNFANGDLPEEIQRLDRVIFGASIHDGAAPLFCKASDGAVLVITANQTRREAAVRAKEILLSWNAQLLGAVLDNRAFPVPESIYRRL